jgi:hypothetical protein
MFDWTISFGNVLQIGAFVVVWIALYFKLENNINIIKRDLLGIEDKQKSLNEAFTQLGNVLTQVAVQDNRLQMIEKAVDELRHGTGFISK